MEERSRINLLLDVGGVGRGGVNIGKSHQLLSSPLKAAEGLLDSEGIQGREKWTSRVPQHKYENMIILHYITTSSL